MAVIGMIGPHAIGKTTACYRWLQRYPNLTAVIADDQWEATSEGKTRVREWKGTVEQKQALVEVHQSRAGVTVIDSVRTTNINYFGPTDPVIIVVCSWQVMGKVLRDRCERNGKKFRDDYWTEWKLGYESHRRYLNYAKNRLKPEQYRIFNIDNQARDWPDVDAYFGQLYRRIHNQLNRVGAK